MRNRSWNLQFIFRPRTLWVGAYWRRVGNCVDVWICFIPMVPLHFSFWGETWGMQQVDHD